MADFPDGSNYVEPKLHPLADLWKDIPIAGEFVRQGRGKRKLWRRTAPGVITMPTTPSRLAEHAELVGYVYDPDRARIKRLDPSRFGKSITNPGTWVDVTAPEPAPSPVNDIAAQAELAKMSGAELMELSQRLAAQAEARR